MQSQWKRRLKVLGWVALAFLIWLVVVNIWSPTAKVRFDLKTAYGVADPAFRETVTSLLGPPLTGGNCVRALQNGDQIFPEMLKAINAAKISITLETFIYWKGHIGEEFTKALAAKAKSGVKVEVLLDWIGSRQFDQSLLQQLRDAGAEVYFYHPMKWYDLDHLNNRTHRRFLVVDGTLGFIGGVAIADEWDGNGMIADHWRDSHYEVQGPVVAQLQAGFGDNWMQTRPDVLHGLNYYPPLTPLTACPDSTVKHPVFAQVFRSSSKEGSSSARLMFLYSISAARKSIEISTAYFVPDAQSVEELHKAVDRGVKVRILVPGNKTDSRVVLKASRGTWGQLMKFGVEMWEYQPAMLHNKMMIVDDIWTTVGSANFDPRSFRLNEEANLNVLDQDFAIEQRLFFDRDLSRAKKISYEEWESRPWLERASDYALDIFNPQL